MQEINKEIADRYDLDIRSIVPFKDTFIINCDKGKRILKKTDLSPERIMFVHGAKEHLFNNNFKNLDRYVCTTDGQPYIITEESCYTMTAAIEGKECNFDNRNEIIKASSALAALHKASAGYVPLEDSKSRDDLGKTPSYFSKRLDEIKKLRKIARKGKSKFDYLFLEHVDYFYSLGEDAIEGIGRSKYSKLVQEAKEKRVFCHHDFTHSNIICSENNLWITNFDFCCFELKIYDIANLIRRKMRKCDWDIDEAKTIIKEYRSTEEISEDEFYVMKLMLQFPQKFWRVINKYYNSRRSWSEKSYVSRLQEVIDEIEFHKRFLEQFDKLI